MKYIVEINDNTQTITPIIDDIVITEEQRNSIGLESQYDMMKNLEQEYWEIFINKHEDYHNNPDTHVELSEVCAYQCVWNNMYDAFNNIAHKINRPTIRRTF